MRRKNGQTDRRREGGRERQRDVERAFGVEV